MSTTQYNVRLPEKTAEQIQKLIEATGMTQTQLIIVAIDRMYQEKERPKRMTVHEISINKAGMSIMQDLASKGFEPTHEAKSNIGAMYTFINDQEFLPVDKRVASYHIRKEGKLVYSGYPSRGEEDYSYIREEDGKVVYSSRKTDKYE